MLILIFFGNHSQNEGLYFWLITCLIFVLLSVEMKILNLVVIIVATVMFNVSVYYWGNARKK